MAALLCFERLIHRLCDAVRVQAVPIAHLLRTLADTAEFADFAPLRYVIQHLAADGAFSTAWHEAVSHYAKIWRLSDREITVIGSFADGLGTTDIRGVLQHGEQVRTRLAECVSDRRDEARLHGRMYVALGFCGSSALALLLL